MQVPSLSNVPPISPTNKCFDNIPVGVLKRKNSKDFSLEIELCSFQICDSSKIKRISVWHCFTKQLGVLGTDILILEGTGIKATPDLDHLGTARCMGAENKDGFAYYLDSRNKACLDVANILFRIHKISPTWLSKTSLCDITPKFEAFINIPSVRGLKKMQFEAEYLFKGSVKDTTFSNFLALLFTNTLQLEKIPLSKLECLATHEIKDIKDQMNSPRSGLSLELTDPCKFMQEHETRLVNQIKRVARKRIRWGCSQGDFLISDLAYRSTITYMLRNLFEVGIVQQMAAYDQ